MAYSLLINTPRYREMRMEADRYTHVTGQQAYLYAYSPGGSGPDAATRFVFRDQVCHGIGAALNYARALGAFAEQRARESAEADAYQELIDSTKDYIT